MTRADALAELIAKVEAEGFIVWDGLAKDALSDNWRLGMDAYCGSLDAALALHQAVLPGWVYTIENVTGQTYRVWIDEKRNLRRLGFSVRNSCSARAWLLAILKALHAQEQEMTQ